MKSSARVPPRPQRAASLGALCLALAACGAGRDSAGPRPTSAPTAAASTTSAPETPAASGATAASGRTAGGGETLFIAPSEGEQAGLPPIGLRLHGVWGGFAGTKRPSAGTYLSLGGPPGGTLMFVVKGYRDADPTAAEAASLYRAQLAPLGASVEPVVEGAPGSVRIAGAERPAVAFRTGRSLATSVWCAVQVPSQKLPRQGLFVTAGVGASETEAPDCARVLAHDKLAPLFASLELVE